MDKIGKQAEEKRWNYDGNYDGYINQGDTVVEDEDGDILVQPDRLDSALDMCIIWTAIVVMLVMFGDKDVHCPDDQVQPSWLDSTIEMRLSNLPSTAPGDKCAGMWEFAIGY